MVELSIVGAPALGAQLKGDARLAPGFALIMQVNVSTPLEALRQSPLGSPQRKQDCRFAHALQGGTEETIFAHVAQRQSPLSSLRLLPFLATSRAHSSSGENS